MTSKKDAKVVTIAYQYDAANRLMKIDFTTDTDITYAYDTCTNGKGRLCTMTDASGTTSYEYSKKGQLTKETKIIDSKTYITQYTYDQNGNLKTMTYPSGKVITYNYTNDLAVSVLNGAANLATSITYKPFGGISSLTYGNGLAGSISYDNQYRLSSIQVPGVLNLTSAFDANGNITGITNSLDATKNKSFTYDAIDRLASGTSSGIWGSLAWTYDGVGNRLTENTNSYTYLTNTNKLSNANGKAYTFDNNGNTTAEAARTFTYNDNQRLIRVVDAGVTKGEYTYNGNGQRVKKVANSVTTIFHYDQAGQIIGESNSAGSITTEYVYLNSQPLAKIEGTNVYYYHNDHLATPQKMTNSAKTVVWSADYKPFGETTVTVSTITNNLRFPGQYYDAETGLNYNYFRDYNPVIGRYMQTDPIGIKGGRNHPYIYAANNSLNGIDPTGLECEQITPWIRTTVISDPNNLGTLIDTYTKKTWKLLGVWNGMPIPVGGSVISGFCGCTWQKTGYKRISTYLKDIKYEATFKCCTKKCKDETCTTELRYKDIAQTYTKIEDELSLFGFETIVTTGVYYGNNKCSCSDPNL